MSYFSPGIEYDIPTSKVNFSYQNTHTYEDLHDHLEEMEFHPKKELFSIIILQLNFIGMPVFLQELLNDVFYYLMLISVNWYGDSLQTQQNI